MNKKKKRKENQFPILTKYCPKIENTNKMKINKKNENILISDFCIQVPNLSFNICFHSIRKGLMLWKRNTLYLNISIWIPWQFKTLLNEFFSHVCHSQDLNFEVLAPFLNCWYLSKKIFIIFVSKGFLMFNECVSVI